MKHKAKARKKKRKVKKGQNKHHITPQSRGGGGNNNIVILPQSWHAMWHQLFVNLTIDEVHEYIDLVMQPDRTWTIGQLCSALESMKMHGGYTTSGGYNDS